MVNNNNNLPPVEEIREIKYEVPSFAEFMKNWKEDEQVNYDDLNIGEARGYGPNPEDNGKKKGKSKVKGSEQHLINTFNKHVYTAGECDLWDGEATACEIGSGKAHNITTSSRASMGSGGGIVSGSANYSAYRVTDNEDINIRVGSASLGGEIGGGAGGITAGYSASIDAVDIQANALRVRLGVDVGSNITAGPGGVEVKAAGFGVSIGKKMGFSTPIGEASVDVDDCVVQ